MKILILLFLSMVVVHAAFGFSGTVIDNFQGDTDYNPDLLTNTASAEELAADQRKGASSLLNPVSRGQGITGWRAGICGITSIVDNSWGLLTFSEYALMKEIAKEGGAWEWVGTVGGIVGVLMGLGLVGVMLFMADQAGRILSGLKVVGAFVAVAAAFKGADTVLGCSTAPAMPAGADVQAILLALIGVI